MDNITNLVEEAFAAIEEFEKFMYTNHLEKYITTKEFAASMLAKVSYVESMTRIGAVTEDNLNDVIGHLNSVKNKIAEIKAAFTNGHNIELVVDDEGNYVAKEIDLKEALTSFSDYQPIESSAVKITDYNQEATSNISPVIQPLGEEIDTPIVIEDIKDESAEVINNGQSETTIPQILDDTEAASPKTPKGENFSDALDIKAIDDFINQGGVNGMEAQEPSPGLTL